MSPSGLTRAVSYGRNSSKRQKSIRGQLDANRLVAEERDWSLVAELSDKVSASVYAREERDKWPELLELVPTIGVVLLWEGSRGDRTLASWIGFLDLCRKHGVVIHSTCHSTTYDPRRPRDYRSLAEDGVDAAYESDKTSMRLLRGFAEEAAAGMPHGGLLYGYERVYHPTTGRFVEQRPYPDHADVVREIVRRIGKGDGVATIAKDLTARRISAPHGAATFVSEIVRRARKGEPVREVGAAMRKRGVLLVDDDRAAVELVREMVRRWAGEGMDEPEKNWMIAVDLVERGVLADRAPWNSTSVLSVARNRAYLGVRVHRPKTGGVTEHKAAWEAIITEQEHHAAVRVLTAPDRVPWRGSRNGAATSLLGHIAVCGTCGGKMSTKSDGQYRCCVNVRRDGLDELVTEVVVARLSDRKVFRQLRRASEGDDRTVVEARKEIDRLTKELATWRQSAIEGTTTPDSLAVVEAGITTKIRDARRRAERAGVPPVVRNLVEPGGDVRARWEAAPLGARRDVVKTLMTVTVHSGKERGAELTQRVEIDWRSG